MSARLLQSFSGHFSSAPGERRQRRMWWSHLTLKCAAPRCTRANQLWPSWFNKSAGVEFEGRWFCCRACVEPVLAVRVHSLLSGFNVERAKPYRFPLGLLLVHRNVISAAQLRTAIHAQREAGHGKLGDWLRETAGVSDQQLMGALGQQWGCPVFPLTGREIPAAWSDLIPVPVLESAGAVPAHVSPDGGALYLAFGERIDHTLLYAADQALGYRTFPCVAAAAAVQVQLEHHRRLTSGNNTCFDTIRESPEITSTVCNYAAELRAQRFVVARAGAFLWVRFFRAGATRDLLFRILPHTHNETFERSTDPAKALAVCADSRRGGVSEATTQS